jgi:hypothetical protein
MELLGYHSNLNRLSVLSDESPTAQSRREKGGLIRPLDQVQGESHQGLLDWRLRRSWDVHVHLEFGDRFPVGKVAVRDLFVLVYASHNFETFLWHSQFSPQKSSVHCTSILQNRDRERLWNQTILKPVSGAWFDTYFTDRVSSVVLARPPQVAGPLTPEASNSLACR